MRNLRIFAIGTAATVLAFTARFWAKYALFIAAGLPLAFLVYGQLLVPQSKRSLRLWMNPEVVKDLGKLNLRLSGKDITLAFFKRWYEFKIEVFNVWLLAAIGLVSLGALAIVSTMNDLPMPGFSYVYFGGSAWLVVCYLAWRWILERRAMRKSGISLGSFRVTRLEKPFMKRVVYHFNDEQGGYHGGSFRTLFCDTLDDLTIVFYDESDPEISVPASAMMFHKLKWSETQSHDL
jgi:drug/metabolite transporter superfamily protein YnfA